MYMLGDRIKLLRKQQGLTQTELGKKIGISQTAVISYEKNVNVPPVDRLSKMADIFDVSVDYMLGKTDDRTTAKKCDVHTKVIDLEDELSSLILHLNEGDILFRGKEIDDTTRTILMKSLKKCMDLAKNLSD